MGKVLHLQITPAKSQPPIEKDEIALIHEAGIQGDFHFRDYMPGAENHGRDVCIYRRELLDWMEEQEVQGLCFGRHKENILLEGFGSGELRPGTILNFPDAQLEVSGWKKHCLADQCELAQKGYTCQLKDEYQLCRIRKTGKVRVGDTVFNS